MVMQLSLAEKILLSFVFFLFFAGIISSYVDTDWFDSVFIAEDGFIEWMTVAGLLLAAAAAVRHLLKKNGRKSFLFICCMLGIIGLSIFAAGEELSWGQRIFNIETPEYFLAHNAQQETNVHNLIVGETKLNKLVFTTILGIAAGLYLIAVPLLHKYANSMRRFIDRAGVPVPKFYQVLAIAVVAILHLTAKSNIGKQSELLEFGVCVLFFMIVAFPANRYVFYKPMEPSL